MANKALATRQRMQFRVEPSQKPRQPVAGARTGHAPPPRRDGPDVRGAPAKAKAK